MNPMKKSIMLWQADHCREQTVADWGDTLALGDIDCIRVKSHDGLSLMGAFYSHPLAPVSLDEIQRQYEEFGAGGIVYVPWCNPLGRDVPAEAQLAIDVARRCGNRLDVDIEVGPEFWDVHNPAIGNKRIPEYFQRIADAGIEIVVDTAMFDGWVEALRLVEIAPLVKRLLSQSYDIGFKTDYRRLFDHDVAEMRRTGVRELGIVLDARAGKGIAERAAYAQSLGCTEVSCWAADMATPDTYHGFLMVPSEPFLDDVMPTPPPVPNDDLWTAMAHKSQSVRDSAVTLAELATPGDTRFTEQQSLDEAWRITEMWQTAALEIRDLALRLKG